MKKEVAPGILADEKSSIRLDGKEIKPPKPPSLFTRWLVPKLRRWLFPEYSEVVEFMEEVQLARKEIKAVEGQITFEKPVVFLGSLVNCKVDIKPTLKPEIILSKIGYTGLGISGSNQTVRDSMFQMMETAIKLNQDEDKIET